MPRLYTLQLICPRCQKEDQITVADKGRDARINCGDCLIERVEVVEMKLVNVTCHPESK